MLPGLLRPDRRSGAQGAGYGQSPFEQFAIPSEMRAFAEQSVVQSRKAFESFIDAANEAMGQIQGRAQAAHSSASEIAHKSLTYAEKSF
ncbi:MAG: hypothetical protein WB774_12580 [Xanthobacteraceae bacterium]